MSKRNRNQAIEEEKVIDVAEDEVSEVESDATEEVAPDPIEGPVEKKKKRVPRKGLFIGAAVATILGAGVLGFITGKRKAERDFADEYEIIEDDEEHKDTEDDSDEDDEDSEDEDE